MTPIVVLTPTACLGTGMSLATLEAGMTHGPHVVAVEVDPLACTPFHLGAGVPHAPREAIARELEALLPLALGARVPLIVGTGGAGAHLDWHFQILRDIARERGLHYRLALVPADVEAGYLSEKIRNGAVLDADEGSPLTAEMAEASARLVARVGVDPIALAVEAGAEVVLAGRCAAGVTGACLPLRAGFAPELAVHLGLLLEAGGALADPRDDEGGLVGTIERDHFRVTPADPGRRCQAGRVAAQSLAAGADPRAVAFSGGALDLSDTCFEQADERTVRVFGGRYRPARRPTVTIEGVRRAGFRTICLGGIRDPRLLEGLDAFLAGVRERVREAHPTPAEERGTRLLFRVYGRDGVLGDSEPRRARPAPEVGLVIEAIAPDQEAATALCAAARAAAERMATPGRVAPAGSLAFPYLPAEIPMGAAFETHIFHRVEEPDPLRLFPIEMLDV